MFFLLRLFAPLAHSIPSRILLSYHYKQFEITLRLSVSTQTHYQNGLAAPKEEKERLNPEGF